MQALAPHTQETGFQSVRAQMEKAWLKLFAQSSTLVDPQPLSATARSVWLLRASLLLAFGLLLMVPAAGSAQSCSQLRSCAEAMESPRRGNCGIDGDGDGIPCEATLCQGYRPAAAQPRATPGAGSPRIVPIVPTGPAARPAASGPPAAAAAGPVELVSVGDGDTIRVRDAAGQLVTVRLACIDAPETAQGPPGDDATAALGQLLAVGRLELRPQTVDRYGRTVAEVLAAGRNVNLEMVRSGAAFVFYRYLRDCNGAAYEQAEQQAQRFRHGVWRWDQGIERPWDFRSRRSNPQA
jgi:endonuclease YncB( thermonuclease family)